MKRSLFVFALFLFLSSSVMPLMAVTMSTFSSRTDFRDESIYFVITTRFYDGDASNNVHCWDSPAGNEGDPEWRGDFKGLIERMDYIKALGFTAIWMTPVVTNASGYDYHGYHAFNFDEVDKRYESSGVSFQDVIDAAHARGMKIILDIVLNHTGNFGEYNLCREFERNWSANQSDIDACMIPQTVSMGGPLPDNYTSLPAGQQYDARLARMKNTDGVNHDDWNKWHHFGNFNWDNSTRWWAQIAGDCVDLNTENPITYQYLLRCYNKFIAMGVDGFRIDTSGHMPRLTFNKAFIPAFTQAGADHAAARGTCGTPFYMFGEVCARANDVTYRNQVNMSPYYYTWAESVAYSWQTDTASWHSTSATEHQNCDVHPNHQACQSQNTADSHDVNASTPTSQNAILSGNTYHTPDYTSASGFNVIDFPTHWNFKNISGAWNTASPSNDKYYNDATWNVVYVDSHDYGPDFCQRYRYTGSQAEWAENLDLMFTYRGIPCLYYGSEIEFKKGCEIDQGTNIALQNSGRAYYGGYLTGSVDATGFGQYTATGNAEQTLLYPLAQHVRRLNLIRQAVPALRKGQYSRTGCSGSYAFKRRYTDANTDSYVLVCISGNATFTNIENGTYTDCVTGDVQQVTNGSLSVTCSGQGNMRVYVLSTALTPAPGKVGADGHYLYTSAPVASVIPNWDGQQEALVNETPSSSSDTIWTPCLTSADEHAVFFTKPTSWGKKIRCYVWDAGNGNAQKAGSWPGSAATALGNGVYKYVFTETPGSRWMIIWNDGSNQTNDLTYQDHGMWTGNDRSSISCTSTVTAICDSSSVIVPENTAILPLPAMSSTAVKRIENGQLIIIRDGVRYSALGLRLD